MPETTREICMDMRERIDHVLITDWQKYINSMVAIYDQAYTNVDTLLKAVNAAIQARKAADQALMVTSLTILTGGLVGAFAEGLVKPFPKLTATAWDFNYTGTLQAITVIQEDPLLFKLFKGMTKDAFVAATGATKDFGLSKLQGTPPSNGFSPVGMRVEEYRSKLSEGIINRADCLWHFADWLYQSADQITSQSADSIRKNLYKSEFFTQKYRADKDTLLNKAELALWCAWGLVRDKKYWEKTANQTTAQRGLQLPDTESVDFAPLRDRLVELGVPDSAVTVNGSSRTFWSTHDVKGLDVSTFMYWVSHGGMVHGLFDGIPVTHDTAGWAQMLLTKVTHAVAK